MKKVLILLAGLVFVSSLTPLSAFASGGKYDYQFFSQNNIVGYNPQDTGCDENQSSDVASLTGTDNPEKIWNYYTSKGLKPTAIAGIMGNFSQESSFDPAVKQNQSTTALPDGGDGVTGFGIAQWTSQGRQAGILAAIKAAGLAQYYGAGWGAEEKDKEIPQNDSNKLLLTELNYSWSGDSTPISSFADKLNAASSVEGDGGSTLIFHNTYEGSADNASQLQERVKDATTLLAKYNNGGGDCSSASLGGVSSLDDAVAWAQKFVSDTNKKYPGASGKATTAGSTATLKVVYQFSHSGGFCWGGGDCGQCTAASGWFVTNMTSYTYGNGNGQDVVNNLKAKGVPTGSEPKPFSIFSMQGPGAVHTGVVLGVLSDGKIITLEDNYNGSGIVTVIQYASLNALIHAQKGGSIIFAYVGDKLKGSAAGLGGTQ